MTPGSAQPSMQSGFQTKNHYSTAPPYTTAYIKSNTTILKADYQKTKIVYVGDGCNKCMHEITPPHNGYTNALYNIYHPDDSGKVWLSHNCLPKDSVKIIRNEEDIRFECKNNKKKSDQV